MNEMWQLTNNRSESLPDLSLVRGELRVLNITIFLMMAYVALNYFAFFRLIGVPGIAPILLLLTRGMDLLIVLVFIVFCSARVKLRAIDLLLIVFALYPFLIGLARGNISITFVHDAVIYLFFIAKIVIFRTILIRISAVVDLDTVVRKSTSKLIIWSALIAILSLGTATIALAQGNTFYFQAPAELTFAAALLLAQTKIFSYLFFFVLALAAGKRMIMVSLLVMALIAVFTSSKFRAGLFRFALISAVLAPFAVIFGEMVLTADFIFADKILETFRLLSYAMEKSEVLIDILKFADPARFAEYVSLKPYLTEWSLWFGNGYGFRYELDTEFLAEFGYSDGAEVTNAHFTPLGITAKFGLLGVLIWFALIATVLTSRFDRHSYVQYACRLAFVSMIVQSLFAFGFFIDFSTPFYIAAATVGVYRANSSGRFSVTAKQQEKFK